jgi:hypothetical protein
MIRPAKTVFALLSIGIPVPGRKLLMQYLRVCYADYPAIVSF